MRLSNWGVVLIYSMLDSEFPQVFVDNLEYFVTHFPKEIYAFLRNSVWRDDKDNIYSRK